MTAKPWPHGWRPQMRLLPVPEYEQGPRLVVALGRDGHWLKCVDEHGDIACSARTGDPRVQPDLGDDGTAGVMLGLVREAMRASRKYDLAADIYVLECDEEFGTEDDGPICGWFDGITGRSYAGQGEAYKAALDHFAENTPARKRLVHISEIAVVGDALFDRLGKAMDLTGDLVLVRVSKWAWALEEDGAMVQIFAGDVVVPDPPEEHDPIRVEGFPEEEDLIAALRAILAVVE